VSLNAISLIINTITILYINDVGLYIRDTTNATIDKV
jgi:hypothetical protein